MLFPSPFFLEVSGTVRSDVGYLTRESCANAESCGRRAAEGHPCVGCPEYEPDTDKPDTLEKLFRLTGCQAEHFLSWDAYTDWCDAYVASRGLPCPCCVLGQQCRSCPRCLPGASLPICLEGLAFEGLVNALGDTSAAQILAEVWEKRLQEVEAPW